MHTKPSRRTALGALFCAAAPTLFAQPLSRPLEKRKLVTTGEAGGAIDRIARQMVQVWGERAGISFHMENLPGAGGLLAANRVLIDPADGNTLLFTHSGLINTVPQVLGSDTKFDPEADLSPLAIVGKVPFFLFTAADSTAVSIADIQAQLSRSGDTTNYGVTPAYGASHVAGYMLFRRLGVKAQAVQYKQLSQLLLDVATKRVSFGISSWSNVQPMLLNSKLRVISGLSAKRVPFAAAFPALTEQGLADCAHDGWLGVFHRREVLTETVRSSAKTLQQMFGAAPPLIDLANFGFLNFYMDAESSAAFIRRDIVHHRQLLKQMTLV
jgi:tripartite-type tricarboxylate transporter receptor subunit TctC